MKNLIVFYCSFGVLIPMPRLLVNGAGKEEKLILRPIPVHQIRMGMYFEQDIISIMIP